MANSVITVNVDKKTKDEANKIFNDLGLNMSTAVNIFLKACIKENGIPFLINKKDDK
jgi:DNA-damage-inducible protein J